MLLDEPLPGNVGRDADPEETGDSHALRASVAVGGSAYLGDIVQGAPVLNQMSAALSLGISYDLAQQFRIKANLSILGAKGDDKKNDREDYRQRNLNFKTTIWELAFLGELDLLNSEKHKVIPYIFAGPGIYHFNPTTVDRNGKKVDLHDIGTEGQLLPGGAYDDHKYNLTQLNLQVGGGVRYMVNDGFSLGLDLSFRKLFTDYLDDISGPDYPSPAEFIAAGQTEAAQLAFRGDEIGYTYDQLKYRPRGNPDNKDLYYSFQVTAAFLLR